MIRWPWQREVTRDETPTLFGERECRAVDQFEQRLEAVRKVDSILDETCAQLEEYEAPPRATARVFLMPLRFNRLTDSVAYLSVRGWRMKFRGKWVEMIRSYE